MVDYLYVYDDFSQDNTWEIVKSADYAIRGVDDVPRLQIPRPNYHHLLESIRQDFTNEDVWVVLTMGDRLFDDSPAQIVEEATTNAVEGLQIDCLKDDWTEENDPWPNCSNIQSLCARRVISEHCIVAYKLTERLSYLKAPYPWPHGLGDIQYKNSFDSTKPRLLHYGRRSPRGHMWRYKSGSRKISVKYKDKWDLSTFESTVRTVKFFNGKYNGLQAVNVG